MYLDPRLFAVFINELHVFVEVLQHMFVVDRDFISDKTDQILL